MALVGKPESFNQLTASPGCISCWEVMELEYAFGMPVRPDGSTYPQAGLFDWMTANANATVWNFNIRPGAKWSDGNPITSADVNFTFGLKSGYIFGTPADFLGLGTNLVSISVLNGSETQFNLSASQPSFGPLLAAQSYYTIVPQHILQGTNYTSTANFGQDVTSGPFYHLAYDGGNDLVLKANPYYWNGPGVSEIDVTFVAQSSLSATLLAGNQTDLTQITPDLISPFVNNSQYGIDAEHDRGILYLEYNVSESPFNTAPFRQALAYGIDTNGIVSQIYHGYATPGVLGEGTIAPSATQWHNSSAVQYSYNVTKAKAILTAANYTYDSSGNLHYPNGTAVSFTIYTDNDVITDYETSQLVSTDLSAIGIQTTVVAESLATIAGDYISGSGNIRSQLVIASNTSPIFGLGFLDIEPGFNVYFPWFYTQPAWLEPASAQSEFNNLTSIVNSSTNQTQVRQAVMGIDGLNSENLPLIVLAYPDTIWVYRVHGFTGFPSVSSTTGFDMGAISLDPYTFSQITAVAPTSTTATTTTSGQTTTTGTGTTLTSSSTPAGSSSGGGSDNTVLYAAAAIIIVIIVVGSFLGMMIRRRPRSPAEPSPNV